MPGAGLSVAATVDCQRLFQGFPVFYEFNSRGRRAGLRAPVVFAKGALRTPRSFLCVYRSLVKFFCANDLRGAADAAVAHQYNKPLLSCARVNGGLSKQSLLDAGHTLCFRRQPAALWYASRTCSQSCTRARKLRQRSVEGRLFFSSWRKISKILRANNFAPECAKAPRRYPSLSREPEHMDTKES